jgi:hypothetical protein
VNWEAVTALSTAFTGIVIVVTAIAAVDQLRQARVQRRDAASVELVRTLQDTEWARCFWVIDSLPTGISGGDLRARGTQVVEAAQIVAFRFEMLGVLVHRGTISFDVVEDLCGGATLAAWLRLKGHTMDTRVHHGYPMYLEWFQWLAEQFEKRNRFQKTPAHERHRDWTPPRRT